MKMKKWKMKTALFLLFFAVTLLGHPVQAAGNMIMDGVEYSYRPKKESFVVVSAAETLPAGSKVVIRPEISGKPVTEIKASAFSECRKLRVYIPGSVKRIAKNAFGKNPGTSIKMLYCVKNSAAQRCARKNRIVCKPLSAQKMKKMINSRKVKNIELTLETGEKYSLSSVVSSVLPAEDSLIYRNDAPEILSLDENGELEAMDSGKAVVTVSSAKNEKAGVEITVYVKPGRIKILGTEGDGKNRGMHWDITEGAQGYEVWSCARRNGKYQKVRTTKKLYAPCNDSDYYKVRAFRKVGSEKIYGEFSSATTMKKVSGSQNIQSGKARAIADAYIASELGDAAQLYTYYEADYHYQKNTFLVTYIRRLGRYITEDSLFVFITSQGKVFAFTARNRDKFNSYREEDIDKASLDRALLAVEKKLCEIDDIRIILDEKSGKQLADIPISVQFELIPFL